MSQFSEVAYAELTARARELRATIYQYVIGPKPSGDGAWDAFDAEIAGMERELAELTAEIRSREGNLPVAPSHPFGRNR